MLKPKVLFLCGANSCRTQMAEALLRELASDRLDAMSAGYEPAREVSPDAIDAMRELGMTSQANGPRQLMTYLGSASLT